jgi:DNA-binding CsgD family transcriptional regulator
MKKSGIKKQLCISEKEHMLRWKQEGVTQKEIAKRLNVSESTVSYNLKRIYMNDFSNKRYLCGRKTSLTKSEMEKINEIVEGNRRLSGPKIANIVKREMTKEISSKTAKRYIKLRGFKAATAKCVPYISEVNKKKRLDFAIRYILRPKEFWKKVIWTDETKLCLFSSDGKTWVWRRVGEALEDKVTNKTVKYNGGIILLWGCIGYNGVGNLVKIDGIMDGLGYVRILQENLSESREKIGLGNDFVFQQDNDPKHKSKIAKNFFLRITLK